MHGTKKRGKESIPLLRSEFRLPYQLRILAALILLIFAFGVLGYKFTKGIHVSEALADTLATLAFMPVNMPNAGAQIVHTFIAVFGIIVIWWSTWTVFDFMIQGKFSVYFREMKIMAGLRRMRGHYIVCGGGRVGEHIATLMRKRRISYVLIDNTEKNVQRMQEDGLNVVYGDALHEATLLSAGVKHAKAVIAALPETEKNILVTLACRDAAPRVKIYARAERHDLIKRLKGAGADVVVMPEVAGAEEMFSHITGRARNVSSLHM